MATISLPYESHRFNPQPSADFLCAICQCVLWKPLMCPCQHIFCQGCIEAWLLRSPSCPTCRRTVRNQKMTNVPPMVQSMLNALTMDCEYKANGCSSLVPMENFQSHTQGCEYRVSYLHGGLMSITWDDTPAMRSCSSVLLLHSLRKLRCVFLLIFFFS